MNSLPELDSCHSQSVYYKPSSPWVGELQLPTKNKRCSQGGVLIRLLETPSSFAHLRQKCVKLVLLDNADNRRLHQQTATTVKLDERSQRAIRRGCIVPKGVDGWHDVSVLESLAAMLEHDGRQLVKLDRVCHVSDDEPSQITIERTPVAVAGPEMALVQFLESPKPIDSDGEAQQSVRVKHYNSETGLFDGPKVEVVFKQGTFLRKDDEQHLPIDHVHLSPLNATGYYIYGYRQGSTFRMQALEPRQLFSVKNLPNKEQVNKISQRKLMRIPHRLTPEILDVQKTSKDNSEDGPWRLGDSCILLHLFGGFESVMEGKRDDFSFGHFSFGIVDIVQDPFTADLRFHVTYHQLYTNTNSHILSCRQDWSLYMGGLGNGVFFALPVWDVVLSLPGVHRQRHLGAEKKSLVDIFEVELEKLMAYYRVGNGNGYVRYSMSTSCVQDSLSALYVAMDRYYKEVYTQSSHEFSPEQVHSLRTVNRSLRRLFTVIGSAPRLWQENLEGKHLIRSKKTVKEFRHGMKTLKIHNALTVFLAIMRTLEKSQVNCRVIKSSQFGVHNKDHRATPPVNFWHYLWFELQYDAELGKAGLSTVFGACRRYMRNFFRFAFA